MNYRRGGQRLYAVLAAVWIAVFLVNVPNYRLRFWEPWSNTDEQASKPTDVAPDSFVADSTTPGKAAPLVIIKSEPLPLADRPLGGFLWLAEWALLPPVFGYVLFFLVVPWVYRGFKSGSSV